MVSPMKTGLGNRIRSKPYVNATGFGCIAFCPMAIAKIIVPWAIPQVIQAAMWRWMLNSDVGPIGDLTVRLGLAAEPPLFLVNQVLAIGSVFLAYTWKGASITAFFLMARRT